MQENIINAFAEQAKSMYSPLTKLNTLMVENIEKMTEFQLNSIKSYADLSIDQLKKASDVKDADSLRNFSSSQNEVAATVNKKIMEDAKSLADIANEFKSQIETVWKDSTTVASKATEKKTAKSA
jgi:phasin family protein